MKSNFIFNSSVFCILFLFVCSSFFPVIIAENNNDSNNIPSYITQFDEIDYAIVTCYANGPKNSLISDF